MRMARRLVDNSCSHEKAGGPAAACPLVGVVAATTVRCTRQNDPSSGRKAAVCVCACVRVMGVHMCGHMDVSCDGHGCLWRAAEAPSQA